MRSQDRHVEPFAALEGKLRETPDGYYHRNQIFREDARDDDLWWLRFVEERKGPKTRLNGSIVPFYALREEACLL